MPVRVQGPDGEVHAFPDGTPPETINASLSQHYGYDNPGSLVPYQEQPKPLEGAGAMPPGTVPGGMQAQANAPEAGMVPLSAQAQRAQKMLGIYSVMGDRAGVMGSYDALQADPTYEARKAQSQVLGKTAGTLDAKQQAGTRVYKALNDLELKAHAWYEHAPDAFNGAIGPWNSNDLLQTATGWSNRGAQAFHTLLDHDIEKLTALYREMPSSGASAGSDAQDANFKKAMGEWTSAPSPETAFAILDSAKKLIREKAGLASGFDIPHEGLDTPDVMAINRYAKYPVAADSPYVSQRARATWGQAWNPGTTRTPDVAGALAAKTAEESGASGASGRPRFTNPQTGEKVEWDGTKYVRVP